MSYLEHFGLVEAPFALTPKVTHHFVVPERGNPADLLEEAIERGEGLLKVTGEPGTGKSLLCRVLGQRLQVRRVVGYVPAPVGQDVTAVLALVCQAFGLPPSLMAAEMTTTLRIFLEDRLARGHGAVLIIDEAQTLGLSGLEAVRLLSTFETDSEKLVRIVLVGQPELNTLLASADLRQLAQRITAAVRTEPFSIDQSIRYIDYRIACSRSPGVDLDLFAPRAKALLAHAAEGVPRLLNALCDRALRLAAEQGALQVTDHHAVQAIEGVLSIPRTEINLESEVRDGHGSRLATLRIPTWGVVAAAIASVVIVGGVAVALYPLWRADLPVVTALSGVRQAGDGGASGASDFFPPPAPTLGLPGGRPFAGSETDDDPGPPLPTWAMRGERPAGAATETDTTTGRRDDPPAALAALTARLRARTLGEGGPAGAEEEPAREVEETNPGDRSGSRSAVAIDPALLPPMPMASRAPTPEVAPPAPPSVVAPPVAAPPRPQHTEPEPPRAAEATPQPRPPLPEDEARRRVTDALARLAALHEQEREVETRAARQAAAEAVHAGERADQMVAEALAEDRPRASVDLQEPPWPVPNGQARPSRPNDPSAGAEGGAGGASARGALPADPGARLAPLAALPAMPNRQEVLALGQDREPIPAARAAAPTAALPQELPPPEIPVIEPVVRSETVPRLEVLSGPRAPSSEALGGRADLAEENEGTGDSTAIDADLASVTPDGRGTTDRGTADTPPEPGLSEPVSSEIGKPPVVEVKAADAPPETAREAGLAPPSMRPAPTVSQESEAPVVVGARAIDLPRPGHRPSASDNRAEGDSAPSFRAAPSPRTTRPRPGPARTQALTAAELNALSLESALSGQSWRPAVGQEAVSQEGVGQEAVGRSGTETEAGGAQEGGGRAVSNPDATPTGATPTGATPTGAAAAPPANQPAPQLQDPQVPAPPRQAFEDNGLDWSTLGQAQPGELPPPDIPSTPPQ